MTDNKIIGNNYFCPAGLTLTTKMELSLWQGWKNTAVVTEKRFIGHLLPKRRSTSLNDSSTMVGLPWGQRVP